MDSLISEPDSACENDDLVPLSSGTEPVVYPRAIPGDRVDPDAVKVIRRLLRHGYTAFLVGGGVRDLLLDRKPKDFDVATSARPHEVRSLFRNCRIIGRRFRLAHILFSGGKVIETATFRRDPMQAFDEAEGEFLEEMQALGGRKERNEDVDLLIRHDNVFGEPHEDAIRRDFTINGLFYDIERGEVIDYVGGMPDIDGRVVRTIGDAGVRFREDPVRILRAIKFSARLDLGIAPNVYDASVEHRSEICRAAKPRVFEEILRLLRGGAAHRSVFLCWDMGVLGVILPEVASFLEDEADEHELVWKRLQALDRRVQRGEDLSDTVLFAALVHGPIREVLDGRNPVHAYEDFVEPLVERLAVPRRFRERVRLMVLSQSRLHAGKVASLRRRDFFPDAAALFALEAEARGREVPEWAVDVNDGPVDEPYMRTRKRRRRRHR